MSTVAWSSLVGHTETVCSIITLTAGIPAHACQFHFYNGEEKEDESLFHKLGDNTR